MYLFKIPMMIDEQGRFQGGYFPFDPIDLFLNSFQDVGEGGGGIQFIAGIFLFNYG